MSASGQVEEMQQRQTLPTQHGVVAGNELGFASDLARSSVVLNMRQLLLPRGDLSRRAGVSVPRRHTPRRDNETAACPCPRP